MSDVRLVVPVSVYDTGLGQWRRSCVVVLLLSEWAGTLFSCRHPSCKTVRLRELSTQGRRTSVLVVTIVPTVLDCGCSPPVTGRVEQGLISLRM